MGLSPRLVVRQSFLCHPDWTPEFHHSFLLNDADECFDPGDIPPIPVIREWLAEERYRRAVDVVDETLKRLVDRGALPLAPVFISQEVAYALRCAGLLP